VVTCSISGEHMNTYASRLTQVFNCVVLLVSIYNRGMMNLLLLLLLLQLMMMIMQGGHKPGKPGILRDFSEHGKLREFSGCSVQPPGKL